jgi:hypothetical protein
VELTLPPEWRSQKTLDDHFRRHGSEVGARDVTHYAELAHQTIDTGTRFTFHRTGIIRIGYYHRRTRRFVVVGLDTNHILSLSRQSENHVRTLAESTYDAERIRDVRENH